MQKTKSVLIARIDGAFGLKGEVFLTFFGEDSTRLPSYNPMCPHPADTQAGQRFLTLTSVRPYKKKLLATFKEISDRTQAEALCGTDLYTSRAAFQDLQRDVFYQCDLIGLRIYDQEDVFIGHIASITNFGAEDLLCVTLDNGDTCYLPFRKSIVKEIRISEGIILIEKAEAYLPEIGH